MVVLSCAEKVGLKPHQTHRRGIRGTHRKRSQLPRAPLPQFSTPRRRTGTRSQPYAECSASLTTGRTCMSTPSTAGGAVSSCGARTPVGRWSTHSRARPARRDPDRRAVRRLVRCPTAGDRRCRHSRSPHRLPSPCAVKSLRGDGVGSVPAVPRRSRAMTRPSHPLRGLLSLSIKNRVVWSGSRAG